MEIFALLGVGIRSDCFFNSAFNILIAHLSILKKGK